MEAKVVEDPEHARFEIYDGDTRAGFLEYHRYRDELALLHTEVDPAYGGQGIGGRLVRGTLDAVALREQTVLPYCTFVRSWIAKHPEYLPLVPEPQRPRFDL